MSEVAYSSPEMGYLVTQPSFLKTIEMR